MRRGMMACLFIYSSIYLLSIYLFVSSSIIKTFDMHLPTEDSPKSLASYCIGVLNSAVYRYLSVEMQFCISFMFLGLPDDIHEEKQITKMCMNMLNIEVKRKVGKDRF